MARSWRNILTVGAGDGITLIPSAAAAVGVEPGFVKLGHFHQGRPLRPTNGASQRRINCDKMRRGPRNVSHRAKTLTNSDPGFSSPGRF